MHVFWCERKLEHLEEIRISMERARKSIEKGPSGVWTQVSPAVREQSKPLIRQRAIKRLKSKCELQTASWTAAGKAREGWIQERRR